VRGEIEAWRVRWNGGWVYCAGTRVIRFAVSRKPDGTRVPTGERAERLAELSAVVERLARVIDPDYIPVWLHKPVPALGDEKPIDVLASGGYQRLARLISELESPVMS
jgi:uncharacterized protein (DUF2384 family)